jgi:glycosyltransferase involved in cell wall biosynthesis
MTDAPRPIRGLVSVPVYNEAANLPAVIETLTRRIPVANILFVDDGSSDGSCEILEAAGVRYLRHPINLGYEEALRTGMREVMHGGYDYVVYFDADGQHHIEDLEKIILVYETETSISFKGAASAGSG